MSRKAIAAASLLFTFLFFFEYMPPFRWVHLPYDLDGFHYPLADYAFQSLRDGRFPQWDPTIYCGMSFVGNIQAALFYPPTWLIFAANLGRERLSYQSLEDLLLAHVWLSFFLCYLWLWGKRLAGLPSVLGAGVFAFSGYLCTQLQHFGLVAGYTWFPLGLWGIDQAVERRSWRPLWKLALASALCFLAGYPPIWIVFAVVAGVYALSHVWRWQAAMGVAVSLIFSLALGAIQLLPAWEASSLREPEPHYGLGVQDPSFFLAYLLPNYFDFGLNTPVETNPGKDYFYLGPAVLIAVPLLIRRRRVRDILPLLVSGAAILVLATNPFGLVWALLQRSSLLADLFRSWYFLAGLMPAFAGLTAYAFDDLLRREHAAPPSWMWRASVILMALWAIVELIRWKRASFAVGWASAFDLLISLAVFSFGIYALRGASGKLRVGLATALILSVGVDYKAFGTSKRFDASAGDAQRFSFVSFPNMDQQAYQQLRANADYRIVLDYTAVLPNHLRHIGLMTPQGFDPLLTTQFRRVAETFGQFRTDREFDVDPDNDAAFRLFGVRYVISSEHSPMFAKLNASPQFRLLGSNRYYYKVFEYRDARPPYSWESGSPADRVEVRTRRPEQRAFHVRSAEGGKLALHEQFDPGWTAAIDGKSMPVDRWMGAFQAVPVPAGDHTVEFRFQSRGLAVGAWISLGALIGLAWWAGLDLRHKNDYSHK